MLQMKDGNDIQKSPNIFLHVLAMKISCVCTIILIFLAREFASGLEIS
jgi:hypothetical protein